MSVPSIYFFTVTVASESVEYSSPPTVKPAAEFSPSAAKATKRMVFDDFFIIGLLKSVWMKSYLTMVLMFVPATRTM